MRLTGPPPTTPAMAVVPTVRLLITAIAVPPRLATPLHQLRVVIRLRIIRALRPLAATAVPRVVAIIVAAGGGDPKGGGGAGCTGGGGGSADGHPYFWSSAHLPPRFSFRRGPFSCRAQAVLFSGRLLPFLQLS